ncbi:MAG: hypothetical protein ABI137_07030 [Antricoccus sp.]
MTSSTRRDYLALKYSPLIDIDATAGHLVSFSTAGRDLTSLGSPANTELRIYIGDTQRGTDAVSQRSAAIAFTVPADHYCDETLAIPGAGRILRR